MGGAGAGSQAPMQRSSRLQPAMLPATKPNQKQGSPKKLTLHSHPGLGPDSHRNFLTLSAITCKWARAPCHHHPTPAFLPAAKVT